MSKDKSYLSSYVPEAKPKETPARGKVKSDTDLDEIKKELRELQEWIAKNNRDQLDAMQNIGAKNLSSSFRRSLNGEFVKTNALIQTWADSQEAGFRAIADWQSEQEIILQNINGELENFVVEKDIDAYIDSYIRGDEGVASITQAVSGTFVTRESLGDTLSDYATLGDLPDEDSFVKKTELNAGITSYINGEEGTAAITQAVSGTYVSNQSLSDALGDYARLDDLPSLEGYLLRSELDAGISSYINTQEGTAAVVSAVSGVYVTENRLNETLAGYVTDDTMGDALLNYVKTTELDAEIGAYIDGAEGTAKIVSAASGTFATQDELGYYVKTTELNASIGQYISDDEGQAQIVSAVSGKFLTTDALNGYATTSYVSSTVSQSVANGIAKLTLAVSNGSESSTISLMNGNTTLSSKTITLSGLVSFTDLSTAGSTSINGANIITGTISADMINVNDLKVKNVWFNDDNFEHTILTSYVEGTGTNSFIELGVKEETGWAQFVTIYASHLYIREPGDSGLPPFWIDSIDKVIKFTGGWTIGTEDYYTDAWLDDIRGVGDIYFNNGANLYATSSGLRYIDADGVEYDIDMTER